MMDLLREKYGSAPIRYRDYIETVLYAEHIGYYRRSGERVGREADRDFYTSESLGPVFSRLVLGAAEHLLGPELAGQSTFIEIAAEPGTGLLSAIDPHPFAAEKVIRLGEAISVSGPVVIFANEWLDALPFHRLVLKEGVWRERGVRIEGQGLKEVLMDDLSTEVVDRLTDLPSDLEEGYELDLPLEAEQALGGLIAQDWTGLLLLFDYGKTWPALLSDCPNGTARTYYRHEQGQDLLERPGEQDITCDICWTPLEAQLRTAGFAPTILESQESFLVQRAANTAEAIVNGSAGRFSSDRQTLMELIHPANMGQRFQVLWGLRDCP